MFEIAMDRVRSGWVYRKREPKHVRGLCVRCGERPQKKQAPKQYKPICGKCHDELHRHGRRIRRPAAPEQRRKWEERRAAKKRDEQMAKWGSRVGLVYFLIASENMVRPMVKIGFTLRTAKSRLKGCQTGSPTPLALAGSIAGSIYDEYDLHKRFAAQHSHNEWFFYEAELRIFTDSLPNG